MDFLSSLKLVNEIYSFPYYYSVSWWDVLYLKPPSETRMLHFTCKYVFIRSFISSESFILTPHQYQRLHFSIPHLLIFNFFYWEGEIWFSLCICTYELCVCEKINWGLSEIWRVHLRKKSIPIWQHRSRTG